MKHAVIALTDENSRERTITADTGKGRTISLQQEEYTEEQLEQFNNEKDKWIIRRADSIYFLADSDSGEDARGYYCGYFDLIPENAVFENGQLVGYYLCAGDFRYSGRGRDSFDAEQWGYPGYDPFRETILVRETHLFLFADSSTHEWKDWDLLVRKADKVYSSYIDF